MSSVFNLHHLFTESTSYNVLVNPVGNEEYMNTVIESLEEFNSSIHSSLQALYESLENADTREEENSIFCRYFDQVDKEINKTIEKIQQMVSRFIINVENIVDVNKDILNNTDIISNCNPFVYTYTKYKRINDSNFPAMNPIEIFNKEFDYIGQLLQDLGPSASNQTKLKMIATVYNKLNNTKSDIDRKCIESILGSSEDVENITKLPKKLYEIYKDEVEDKTVDKGLLYSLKLSLENYSNIINSCTYSANTLINQLSEISDKIREIICGNEKNKLKIESSTDGIRNTEYKLDTYSMNQVDLFLKAKISQVVEMINIYYITLSIKLDCTMDYFKQCRDVLAKAELSCDDHIPSDASQDAEDDVEDYEGGEEEEAPESEEIPEPEEEPSEPEEDVEENDDDSDDSDDDDSNDEDEEDSSDDDSDDEEVKEEEVPEPEIEEPEDKEPVNDVDDSVKEFEEAVRIFNHDLFTMFTIAEQYSISKELAKYVHEAEGDNKEDAPEDKGDNKEDKESTTVGKSSDDDKKTKTSLWRKIVEALSKLWDKFASVFKNKVEVRIKWLNENKRYISKEVTPHVNDSGEPVMRDINTEGFKDIQIPDFNADSMKDIADEEAFIKKFFPKVTMGEGVSFKDAVMNMVINEKGEGIKNTKDIKMESLFNWCTKEYMEIMKNIESMNKTIEEALKKAEAEYSKETAQESAVESISDRYFAEFGIEQSKDDKENKTASASKKFDMYFKLCSQMITAKESLMNKVFNEYYGILKWHISKKSEK